MGFAGLSVVLVRLALGFDVVWVLWVGCSFVWLLLGDFAGCRILGRVVWGLQAWVIWVCVLRLTGICGRFIFVWLCKSGSRWVCWFRMLIVGV